MAISQSLHLKLKQLYPEGHALDVDRERDAQTIYNPSSPAQIERWAESKSTTDLKGFDTKSGKEPSIRKVLSKAGDGDSGEDAIQDEPERFVDNRAVAGKLIMKNQDKIVDFNSFVKAVEDSWQQDDSLRNLTHSIRGNQDAYSQMFRTSTIQQIIDTNTRPLMVNFVMKKFGVEPVRASRIVQLLPVNARAKLYRKARLSRLPKIKITKQRSALKRIRWSEQELNIVKRNRNLPKDKLYEIFNRSSPIQRSKDAVARKQKQIRKK